MLLLMSRPRSTTQGWHRRLIQCVRQYRYNIAGLTPRYLAMSLPVCPSAFIRRECGLRLSVVVDALDGRRCGGDTTNHAESGTPSER